MIAAPVGALREFDRAKSFCALYPYRDAYIWKLPGRHWEKVSRRLANHQIEGVIADGGRGLLRGCYWGEMTRFAVLDIDQGSQYHCPEKLAALRGQLAEVGLSGTCLYRSSESGGWHLYVPFEGWVNSRELEGSLKAWLKALGYSLQGGQLEVFPTGNALRLPLQPGFAWLNQSGQVAIKRDELTCSAAIDRFLNDIESNANDWLYTKSRIDTQLHELAELRRQDGARDAQEREERVSVSGFEHLFPAGMIQERWQRGRRYWRDGLTESGQRHDAVLCVGHYLWYGDHETGIAPLPGARHDEYRARLIEQWLSEKHNGMCRHINEGNWRVVTEQIRRAVSWRADATRVETEPYPLTERLLKRFLEHYRKTGKIWTVEEYQRANEDRRELARKKIRLAIEHCQAIGQQITRNGLAVLSGCSPNSVSRHRDLWTHLTTGSGENNPGGGGSPGPWGALPLVCGAGVGASEKEEKKKETPSVLGESVGLVDRCLTPCAEDLSGRRRTTDGSTFRVASPPSPGGIKAQGSSTGLECLRYACGELNIFGLRSGRLRHEHDLPGPVPGAPASNVLTFRKGITAGGKKTPLLEASGSLPTQSLTGDRFSDLATGPEREIISKSLQEKFLLLPLSRNLNGNPTYDGVEKRSYAICEIREAPSRGVSDSPAPEEGSG